MGGTVRKRRKPKQTTSTMQSSDPSPSELEPPKRSKRSLLVVGLLLVAAVATGVILLAVYSPWEESSSISSKKAEEDTTTEEEVKTDTTTEEEAKTEQQQRTGFGTYELLETVPHDSKAFTQGLLTATDQNSDGSSSLKFYEGTGLHGKSELRLLDIATGEVLQRHKIPDAYFGEGIAHYKDSVSDDSLRLIQLTWKESTAFEYTTSTPLAVNQPVANWTYATTTKEGWGVSYSPLEHQFYVTDGSSYLHTWDADTKQEIRKVPVTFQPAGTEAPQPLQRLNEIEWDPATNTVLANVWFQNLVIRIDPVTGFVPVIYDLTSLWPADTRPIGTDVMNGIALTYDSLKPIPSTANTDEVWVTGKFWPSMYRIRLIEP